MISHSKTYISDDENHAIRNLLNRGLIAEGEENRLFRNEFAKYVGADFVKLTSSGTFAFYLILKSLDIRFGDEVLLPDYICKDLLGPLISLGAHTVIYDNAKKSWLTSEDEILSKITNRTKVVVVNHTFGFAYNEISSLSARLPSKIKIIEDCCHAIFSKDCREKLKINTSSLCCFYSFNATKFLAAGEGGAISTSDNDFFKELQKIEVGDKLSDINCSLARTQLKSIDNFIERRNKIANLYLKEFAYLITSDHIEKHSLFFRFPLMIQKNENFWISKIVSYKKGVDSLLSEHLVVDALPNAKEVFNLTVSIPIYPSLLDKEVWTIVSETKRILQL